MKTPHVTIVGANGRLGRALLDRCNGRYDTVGITRRFLDLSWPRDRLFESLDFLETDVLLLTAGLTDVDGCEHRPDLARRINATAVRDLAGWCAERSVRMIHFSTDYVFDGTRTEPYREDDPVNPLSVYGKTKLEGEQAVLAASDRNLVVRLSWLFGAGLPNATPDWAVRMAVEKDGFDIVADKTGSPGFTRDMATAMDPLLFDESATGLLHLANRGRCTWQEWAQFSLDCAAECGVDLRTRRIGEGKLDDFFADKAARPRHTVFSTEKYTALTGRTLPHWKDAVREYVRDHVAPRFLETPVPVSRLPAVEPGAWSFLDRWLRPAIPAP